MMPPRFPTYSSRTRQQGVALFVVIVFVMMSMLLALWSSRTSLFNEMVVGNDADYQRAFEAAQALLQDAELDIRSAETDDSNKTMDGVDCSVGQKVRRLSSELREYQIPASKEGDKVDLLIATLASQTSTYGCKYGLCTKRTGAQDFWNDKEKLKILSGNSNSVGARYGEYTGAKIATDGSPANFILADRSAWNRGGWYWIEVLPYTKAMAGKATPPCNSSGAAAPTAAGGPTLIVGNQGDDNILRPNLDPGVVYRITALAYGRKIGDDNEKTPISMAVLQQTYARSKCSD